MYGKLSEAVTILVTNPNKVKERLWVASDFLFMLDPESVPESCREDVKWVHKMLTRYPAKWPYKTALEATYHRTRNSTAQKIAQRVWTLYHVMHTEVDGLLA